MRVLIVDGQGGGMGKALVEQLKQLCPTQPLLAVGTNALATAAMLRAGADQGATGENAVVVNAARADLILGPHGDCALRCPDGGDHRAHGLRHWPQPGP